MVVSIHMGDRESGRSSPDGHEQWIGLCHLVRLQCAGRNDNREHEALHARVFLSPELPVSAHQPLPRSHQTMKSLDYVQADFGFVQFRQYGHPAFAARSVVSRLLRA